MLFDIVVGYTSHDIIVTYQKTGGSKKRGGDLI